MALAAYPKYRSTECNWLPSLPSHWSMKRLKVVATCNDEALPEMTDPDYEFDYVDISSVSLVDGVKARERMTFEKSPSRARRVVRDGDSIVSTVRTYLKAVATIDEAAENLIVSTGFAVLRPGLELRPKFLGYFVQSHGFVDTVVARSNGVSYPAILATDLITIAAPIPSIAEQDEIANFLDRETARIDALIDKKRRVLALLEEKRLAVITHAVTKGVDPNVPLKDSGIDWLGHIPKHWQVMSFNRNCWIVGGQVDPKEQPYCDMILIAPDHIGSGTGILLEKKTATEQGAISGKYEFSAGDILYSKIRPELRKMCVADFDGLCSADMYAVRHNEHFATAYLFYLLLSKYHHQFAVLESMRVAMPKVNRESLATFRVLIPPVPEQLAICMFIEEETAELQSIRSKQERAIALLLEYRSALITAAVTGKIDVRGLADQKEAAE